MKTMSIKEELLKNLKEINDQLNFHAMGSDTRATMLLAKASTLQGLQRYSVGLDGEVDL